MSCIVDQWYETIIRDELQNLCSPTCLVGIFQARAFWVFKSTDLAENHFKCLLLKKSWSHGYLLLYWPVCKIHFESPPDSTRIFYLKFSSVIGIGVVGILQTSQYLIQFFQLCTGGQPLVRFGWNFISKFVLTISNFTLRWKFQVNSTFQVRQYKIHVTCILQSDR